MEKVKKKYVKEIRSDGEEKMKEIVKEKLHNEEWNKCDEYKRVT